MKSRKWAYREDVDVKVVFQLNIPLDKSQLHSNFVLRLTGTSENNEVIQTLKMDTLK